MVSVLKNHSKCQITSSWLILFVFIFSQLIQQGKRTFEHDICNVLNFWTKSNLTSLMCTLVRRQSGNFAKSWGRHPSIMKKKCIKKILFLSGSTIKAITLSDKYQLHKAAQIFFTLNTFIFKRKWSKLVILLLWVIIRIIKVCTFKCAHYRSNLNKISVSDKKGKLSKLIRG